MLRIAIVEDEEIFARELEEYVRRYAAETFRDVSITHYSDGEEIAGNYRGGFDLLLMDIQMTFMDGMTAAEKIRGRDPEVIIIFITNRADYAVRGYEVDALDYVVKPLEYFPSLRSLTARSCGSRRKQTATFRSMLTAAFTRWRSARSCS